MCKKFERHYQSSGQQAQKLGDTYFQAKRHYLSLERRLHANDKLKQGHTDFVNEFITLQHLEKIPEEENEIGLEKGNFLTHHCVYKEDSTITKIRVLFDGSTKSTSGVSLNYTLMSGRINDSTGSVFNFDKIQTSSSRTFGGQHCKNVQTDRTH